MRKQGIKTINAEFIQTLALSVTFNFCYFLLFNFRSSQIDAIFGPSAILLDLENKEISQRKANQNMCHLQDTSSCREVSQNINFFKTI